MVSYLLGVACIQLVPPAYLLPGEVREIAIATLFSISPQEPSNTNRASTWHCETSLSCCTICISSGEILCAYRPALLTFLRVIFCLVHSLQRPSTIAASASFSSKSLLASDHTRELGNSNNEGRRSELNCSEASRGNRVGK
jgi:hypothetical protein